MMQNESQQLALHMTHEEHLLTYGYDLCSPITGSMFPMIRPRRDVVMFVLPEGKIKRYDVALYRADSGKVIMHRVLKIKPDGYYFRGDNSIQGEFVRKDQVIGVMSGFYRDDRFIKADSALHQTYARLWVALHPLLCVYKRIRWHR